MDRRYTGEPRPCGDAFCSGCEESAREEADQGIYRQVEADKPFYYERTFGGISVRLKKGHVLQCHYERGAGWETFDEFVRAINERYYQNKIDLDWQEHGDTDA